MATRKPLVQINGQLSEIPAADRIAPSALGSGVADATTVLYGDGAFRAPPAGGGTAATPISSVVVTINGVTYTNSNYQG